MTLTIAIIQARMGSTRLPGKVLCEISGRPMLEWVVQRARRAKHLDAVVVATTVDPADDPVAAFCASQGFDVYRGSLHDVLDRYYQAALLFKADIVVRITADCPLIDPGLIDDTWEHFVQAKADFATNRLPPPWGRTYPIGLDTEIATFAALETTWRETTSTHHREHVMPYLYENPERFKIVVTNHTEDFGKHRWTVDTPDDLKLVQEIVRRFDGRDDFTWLEVIDLFAREPELASLNASVVQKIYSQTEK